MRLQRNASLPLAPPPLQTLGDRVPSLQAALLPQPCKEQQVPPHEKGRFLLPSSLQLAKAKAVSYMTCEQSRC